VEEKAAKTFATRGETQKQPEALDQALSDHQQAATLDPEALFGLGRFECRQGHLDQGIADLTLYLQACRTNFNGLMSRACEYESLGNHLGNSGNVKGQEDALAKALADWNQLVALKSAAQSIHTSFRGEYYFRNHQYANALKDFRQAMELQPTDGFAQTSLARFLATCPDPAFRDGTNAVAIAQKACASDHYDDSWSLATLAAAYAETGDFVQAVKWQNQALVNLEAKDVYGDAFRAEMRDRLTLYEKGQPCHQPLGLEVFFE
jgi:tetratricopeptide (TPR) repeat protein